MMTNFAVNAAATGGIAVRGDNFAPGGTGVQGTGSATSGSTIGVRGCVSSSAGTAGVFQNTDAGGKILSAVSGSGAGTEVFSVAGSGVTIGSGAAITKHLSATASLDFPSIPASGCIDTDIAVTGAADGDTLALGVPNALASPVGLVFNAFPSSTNFVKVRACNLSASAIDPPTASFRVDVWKH